MHDDNDDRTIGRILSRRAAMTLLGVGGAASFVRLGGADEGAWDLLAAQTSGARPGCIARPEMTEGPFFVDKQLNRADLRDGRRGETLDLALTIVDATGGQCRPLAGAIVDLWQCDAKGVYSGVSDRMQGSEPTGERFLRGFQVTDTNGIVHFTTIYPGWYSGRTVHVHFKIRTQAAGSAYEFTSQWYFDDTLNDRILAGPDYARPERRDTRNNTDMLFRGGGEQLMLTPVQAAQGLSADFAIGLDLADSAVGRADGFGGGPGRGRGPGPGRRGGGARDGR